MAYPGVLEDVQVCVDLGMPSRVPVFALGEEFDVEQYDIDYRVYTSSPEDMVKCWVQAVQAFDYDWVLLHPDDYIEIEPLGIETITEPRIPASPVKELEFSADVLKGLKVPDASSSGRMPAHLEGLSGLREALGDEVVLAGRVAAPFSGVAITFDPQVTLLTMMTDEGLMRDALEFMGDLMIYWAQEQIKAGARAIWVGDCVASSGFLSPEHYRDFAAPGAYRVCEAIKEAGAWAYYHAGDPSLPHLEISADIEPSMLNVGEDIPLAAVKEALGDQVCLTGNINPIALFEAKTEEEVEEQTLRVLESGKPGGGYIFNTGEGVPRTTAPWIIETMMRTAKANCSYEEDYPAS